MSSKKKKIKQIVKIIFEGDFYRFNFLYENFHGLYERFFDTVVSRTKHNNIFIKYKDEEGDFISVSTDEDLEESFDFYKEIKKKSALFFITQYELKNIVMYKKNQLEGQEGGSEISQSNEGEGQNDEGQPEGEGQQEEVKEVVKDEKQDEGENDDDDDDDSEDDVPIFERLSSAKRKWEYEFQYNKDDDSSDDEPPGLYNSLNKTISEEVQSKEEHRKKNRSAELYEFSHHLEFLEWLEFDKETIDNSVCKFITPSTCKIIDGKPDEWQTVLSTNIFKKRKHSFQVKIKSMDEANENNEMICIGIVPVAFNSKHKISKVIGGIAGGLGVVNSGGLFALKKGGDKPNFSKGRKFHAGDVVRVDLDFNLKTVEFFINSESIGVAYTELNFPVRAGVSFRKKGTEIFISRPYVQVEKRKDPVPINLKDKKNLKLSVAKVLIQNALEVGIKEFDDRKHFRHLVVQSKLICKEILDQKIYSSKQEMLQVEQLMSLCEQACSFMSTTITHSNLRICFLNYFKELKQSENEGTINLELLSFSTKYRRKMGGASRLMFACELGDLESVKLLIKKGDPVNDNDVLGHRSSLMVASAFGHAKVCEYLLENGADYDYIENFKGETAASLALKRKHEDVVEVLSRYGATFINCMPKNSEFGQARFKGFKVFRQKVTKAIKPHLGKISDTSVQIIADYLCDV